MTHKYILRNASAVSIVLEYRFPSNRNYGFLHIGTSVSIPRNEGVKLSGILIQGGKKICHKDVITIEYKQLGAGTIVTKNVPDNAVFCGQEGRVVKIRF